MYSTKIYSEVYYVLSKMEKNIVMMIPIEILEHIKKFSNNTISKDNALEKNIETSNQLIIVKESKIKLFFNRILSFLGLK